MTTATVIALIALILTFMRKPIELMWDKVFEHKSKIISFLGWCLNWLIGAVVPVCLILYFVYVQKTPLEKDAVMVIAMATAAFVRFFTYRSIDRLWSVIDALHERIEDLEKHRQHIWYPKNKLDEGEIKE
jgi:TRAP-type C4-dicarboxylate transport system permease large subunit